MRKRKSAANRNKRQTQTNSSPSTPEQPVPLERHLDPTKESAEDDIEEIPLEILESHASIVERLSGEVAGEQFASAVLSPHPFLWLVSQLKALLYSIQRTFQTSHTGLLDDLGRWFVMALGLSIFGLGQPTEAAPTKALVNDGRKVKRRRRRVDEGAEGPQHFPGMVNLSGVLCYMNSVLQSLASVTSLVTHLEKIIDLAIESDVQTPVSDALTEVISELNTPQSRQPPPLRPHNLLAALHTLPQIRRLLSTREQQDAHELFVVLAEAISNESLKVVAEIARIRGMADVLSLQAYCFDKGSVRSYTPSVSSVGTEGRDIGKERRTKIRGLAQPWEGLVARRRVCKKCGYCGEVRMDTLGGLELPTPMAGHATLNACFADFFAPELLSGVTCEMCSLRETISYYEDEVSRLSLPPNQSHLAASSKRTKPESTFDALENLPSENASGEISDKRRKRCNEAKKVLIRLHEMLASRSVSFFGESIPVDPKSNDAGGEGIKVKWQKVNNDSVRQSIITRPPVTMRLGISRTGVTPYGDVIKKSTRVQIPQILDASEFVSNGVWEEPQAERTMAIKTKRVLYRLDSVICHYGYTTNSGHFISIRRKPTKLSTPTDDGPRWGPEKARMSCPPGCRCSDCVYFGPARGIVQNTPGQGFLRISDDEVEEVGAEALVDAEPAVFMLFYEKIEECAEKSAAVEGRSRERSELQNEASRKSVSVNSTS